MVSPLGGATGESDSGHHRSCKETSMTSPLGVLPVGPTAATTEVVEDVDGRPPGGDAGGSGSDHH
jgi:hypothetical protein